MSTHFTAVTTGSQQPQSNGLTDTRGTFRGFSTCGPCQSCKDFARQFKKTQGARGDYESLKALSGIYLTRLSRSDIDVGNVEYRYIRDPKVEGELKWIFAYPPFSENRSRFSRWFPGLKETFSDHAIALSRDSVAYATEETTKLLSITHSPDAEEKRPSHLDADTGDAGSHDARSHQGAQSSQRPSYPSERVTTWLESMEADAKW
ncbi:hypothetical protein I316_05691 [Kwoniella heveanensis BCC8398]|uniref:Uncharacterized protein n=1 Tax=Kwoniella heveanensis BCC8398 TaxID=1296120 RepID=A0A1B9GND7_9TREE|nr:hypothetical protein I316_05691 [Kwoniella heveanensis BCC8398]